MSDPRSTVGSVRGERLHAGQSTLDAAEGRPGPAVRRGGARRELVAGLAPLLLGVQGPIGDPGFVVDAQLGRADPGDAAQAAVAMPLNDQQVARPVGALLGPDADRLDHRLRSPVADQVAVDHGYAVLVVRVRHLGVARRAAGLEPQPARRAALAFGHGDRGVVPVHLGDRIVHRGDGAGRHRQAGSGHGRRGPWGGGRCVRPRPGRWRGRGGVDPGQVRPHQGHDDHGGRGGEGGAGPPVALAPLGPGPDGGRRRGPGRRADRTAQPGERAIGIEVSVEFTVGHDVLASFALSGTPAGRSPR